MTPLEAARWMADQLAILRYLDQSTVWAYLQSQNPALVGHNANGGLSISPAVLRAFNRLTPDVVWSRSSLHWRYREPYDVPGRMQG